ncbi:TPA: hypothetical protein UMF60_000880 [Stenotrophomonas maltophilia]|nr:hypothetical protein [Stenotrophomonas maltophilia]
MDNSVWKTRKGLAIGASGVFVAGAVCAWTLIGAEPGSRADWVAAAGTWVIGAAACVLARQNNVREDRADREQKNARLIDRRKNARRMIALAKSCREFALKVDAMSVSSEKPSLANARAVAQAAYVRCKAANFDLAFFDVEEDGVDLISELERDMLALTTLIENFQAHHAEELATDVTESYHFKHMVQAASWVARDAEALVKHLEEALSVRLAQNAHCD